MLTGLLGVKEGEELDMPLTPDGGGHSVVASTFVISLLYSSWVS